MEQHFRIFSSLLPGNAFEVLTEQIRRIAGTSSQTLGWGLGLSLGVALWSAIAGTQAMFVALNIAYEEPERRSLFRYYLSAFTFTVIGIISGLLMLFAIAYVPILFAAVGFSSLFENLVRVGRWPWMALFVWVCWR